MEEVDDEMTCITQYSLYREKCKGNDYAFHLFICGMDT